MKLWELKPKQSGKVKNLSEVSELVSHKIRDLGLKENESVCCLQWIPFGGPRVYKLVNGIFALEKSIADNIEVEMNS